MMSMNRRGRWKSFSVIRLGFLPHQFSTLKENGAGPGTPDNKGANHLSMYSSIVATCSANLVTLALILPVLASIIPDLKL